MCKKRLRVIKLKRGDSIFERNVTADGVRSVWNRLQIFRICRETGLTFEFDPGVGSVVSLSRGHGTIYGSFFGYGKEIFMTTEFSVKRTSTRIIIKFKYFNIGRHKIRNPKKLHAFLDSKFVLANKH